MQGYPNIAEQAEIVNGAEGTLSNLVTQIKGDGDQHGEIKRDHADSHPEGTVGGNERHQDLCERIGQVLIEHENQHVYQREGYRKQ